MEEQKQFDIEKASIEELYKVALGEQKNITTLLAQLQQAQANVAALEAEIEKRDKPKK